MKQLISDNGGMQTYLEVTPSELPSHKDWHLFKITTVYLDAKDPTEEHVKFTQFMDADTFNKFKEVINGSST